MQTVVVQKDASQENMTEAAVDHFTPLLERAKAAGKPCCEFVDLDAPWLEYEPAMTLAWRIQTELRRRGFAVNKADDVLVDNHTTFWRRRRVVRICVRMSGPI